MKGKIEVASEYQGIYFKVIEEFPDEGTNTANTKQGQKTILFVTRERFGYCVWKNTIYRNHYGSLLMKEPYSELMGIFNGKYGEGACVDAVRYIQNN